MTDRQQRDLAWCVRDPALIRGHDIWPDDDWFSRQPVTYLAGLEPPPDRFRLGIHFEKLYQEWLQAHPAYELLAANLQINDSGRTLGEFDLLIDSQSGHEHWELAVKFYINQTDPALPSQWFGPDPADTLASKLDRLVSHQLPLASLPAATETLETLGIAPERNRCIIKGRLYHPWEIYQSSQWQTPEIVNPTHSRGWWLEESQLPLLLSFAQQNELDVVYLDKRLWLSPLTSDDQEPSIAPGEIGDFVNESEQIALQFGLVDGDGAEVSRGFILKARWYELSGQRLS